MKPTFLTRQDLGRLTHGRFNPRFRACLRLPTGKVIVARTTERDHAAIRAAHALPPTAGDEGYTFMVGA